MIILVLGASFESKIYPVEKYLSIAKSIDADFIAIWKSESERIMAQKLANESKNIIASEDLSLTELKQLISTASLVIGGDTGPTHLAWALNIPSITLFGSTSGYRNMFETSKNLRLESSSKIDISKINKTDFSISEIEPEKIIDLAKRLLNS